MVQRCSYVDYCHSVLGKYLIRVIVPVLVIDSSFGSSLVLKETRSERFIHLFSDPSHHRLPLQRSDPKSDAQVFSTATNEHNGYFHHENRRQMKGYRINSSATSFVNNKLYFGQCLLSIKP